MRWEFRQGHGDFAVEPAIDPTFGGVFFVWLEGFGPLDIGEDFIFEEGCECFVEACACPSGPVFGALVRCGEFSDAFEEVADP